MKYGLKQRVVGAIILLAGAVIFLPIVLDGERRPIVQTTQAIPPAPPLPEKVDLQPNPTVAELEQPLPAPPPRETGQPGLDEAGLPQAWVVQAASFRQRSNAEALIEQLKQAGYKAYRREVNGLHVVYVGPELNPQRAKQLKQQLLERFRLKGLLVRLES